ncbi:hypothetical protein K402DRAFT_408826 [Aulographum hederae CBS 113979]|uniref:Uncharacterized protein n=1 Tax=Aulographum hederae CBS 113979 TaxID=1176131 RepID=A0A6G1GIY4_9PEZI|nr:hypothetical protein K402DRAFT_408826 [Aulographum hederae CBS 113979]
MAFRVWSNGKSSCSVDSAFLSASGARLRIGCDKIAALSGNPGNRTDVCSYGISCWKRKVLKERGFRLSCVPPSTPLFSACHSPDSTSTNVRSVREEDTTTSPIFILEFLILGFLFLSTQLIFSISLTRPSWPSFSHLFFSTLPSPNLNNINQPEFHLQYCISATSTKRSTMFQQNLHSSQETLTKSGPGTHGQPVFIPNPHDAAATVNKALFYNKYTGEPYIEDEGRRWPPIGRPYTRTWCWCAYAGWVSAEGKKFDEHDLMKFMAEYEGRVRHPLNHEDDEGSNPPAKAQNLGPRPRSDTGAQASQPPAKRLKVAAVVEEMAAKKQGVKRPDMAFVKKDVVRKVVDAKGSLVTRKTGYWVEDEEDAVKRLGMAIEKKEAGVKAEDSENE